MLLLMSLLIFYWCHCCCCCCCNCPKELALLQFYQPIKLGLKEWLIWRGFFLFFFLVDKHFFFFVWCNMKLKKQKFAFALQHSLGHHCNRQLSQLLAAIIVSHYIQHPSIDFCSTFVQLCRIVVLMFCRLNVLPFCLTSVQPSFDIRLTLVWCRSFPLTHLILQIVCCVKLCS
jgi:hypothetical protein